jgi:hypothetical protein
MNIRTNHQPREWLYRSDVPESVLADQFDWLDPDNDHGFVCYQKTWYHVSQFMRVEPNGDLALLGFDGYEGHSYSSGVLVKLMDDDRVIMASYCS